MISVEFETGRGSRITHPEPVPSEPVSVWAIVSTSCFESTADGNAHRQRPVTSHSVLGCDEHPQVPNVLGNAAQFQHADGCLLGSSRVVGSPSPTAFPSPSIREG